MKPRTAKRSNGVLECWSIETQHSKTPTLHHSISPALQSSTTPLPHSAYSLIEFIAVLAILSILALALTLPVVRRVDQAAWTRESSDLAAIADSYTQYILRNKRVPDTNDWALSTASQMSLPVSSVSTNSRRIARAYLVDPAWQIGSSVAGQAYTQTTNGTAKPASARVLLVSSLSRALPIATGVPSSTEFNAIWDTAEGAKPATSTWANTNWPGTGDELRIKKLNLEPLFYQLILVNHDTANSAYYSIDSVATNAVPTSPRGLGFNSYYFDGTVVGLHDCTASRVLQARYLLKQNISFTFESCAWGGAVQGGQPNNPTALDLFNNASAFLKKPLNPGAPAGSSQFSVLQSLYSFMFDFTLWANECPHFNDHGNTSVSSQPEYQVMNNAGQNNGYIDKNSSDVIK